jgi:arginyl-tRNA--protein-N-Asp/Glu arginylyltransferase
VITQHPQYRREQRHVVLVGHCRFLRRFSPCRVPVAELNLTRSVCVADSYQASVADTTSSAV